MTVSVVDEKMWQGPSFGEGSVEFEYVANWLSDATANGGKSTFTH